MKKQSLILAIALLFATTSFSKTSPEQLLNGKQSASNISAFNGQKGAGISFTENKGQVQDQNHKPRPDVLYGAMAGDLALHIKKNGVSYQLYRVDKWKETQDEMRREKRMEIEQQTIYRIDLNWLNHNANFTNTEDEALPGYNNYYLESCPLGALNVKSYKGITLNNLYNGINLHYYEKNGALKHDYIVAPHADYKQIQLQVDGADITLNEDGSLLLSTPLGKVQEGAPMVYQNGEQLKAKWQVKNNILSFEIENYNPNHELIIDPITRIWGTYYGGSATDIGMHCATDVSGNVYLAGCTNAPTGTIIATTGTHQSFQAGGTFDAFLAKFNSAGVRQWGTYYGGTGEDRGDACVPDANGNVYLIGQTNTNTGSNPISTPGSHQPAFGDVFNTTTDAFLVKFNVNGIRQWGTYYGGSGDDFGRACAIDASGNVYMAGTAESHFSIATSGGHQPVFGGGVYDGFLVKFNTNGARQWATFYGNASNDAGYGCCTDASGNVYLAGATYTAANAIATPGSHQAAPGGNSDAYLVKFNTNGARQWGTYYGGTGADYGTSCAADASGNIYFAGQTASPSGTAIAMTGGHQITFGGSNADCFLSKFNASGVRQWSTYYGGTGDDYNATCTTDVGGNVYMSGSTTSNTGTVIATPGSHQATHGGGGSDPFLVKFDGGGIRQSGTYYGGTGWDDNLSCATDGVGNVYIAGQAESTTGTVIATSGAHQPAFGGGTFYDAFLVKFDVCNAAPAQPSVINGPTITCPGIVNYYNTPIAFGANSYTLALPGGGFYSGNNNTFSVTPLASGVFTLITANACGVSPEQTLNVTVHPTPTIAVNNGTICSGESFTIIASGANTYTYSSGPVVSPNFTSWFFVSGTSTAGCVSSNSAVSVVVVNASPTVIVNSGAICIGQSFTITATGADTFTYSTPTVVAPTVTFTYSVTGISSAGCVGTNTAVGIVTVNPLPNVSASTTDPVLCFGESSTITASGASTYTFEPGGAVASITVSADLGTSSYTLTGIDINGCSNTAVITQSVDACTGIKNYELKIKNYLLSIFPNPANEIMNLELESDSEVIITNALGQIVYSCELRSGRHQVNIERLAKGIYLVRVGAAAASENIKIIKQ